LGWGERGGYGPWIKIQSRKTSERPCLKSVRKVSQVIHSLRLGTHSPTSNPQPNPSPTPPSIAVHKFSTALLCMCPCVHVLGLKRPKCHYHLFKSNAANMSCHGPRPCNRVQCAKHDMAKTTEQWITVQCSQSSCTMEPTRGWVGSGWSGVDQGGHVCVCGGALTRWSPPGCCCSAACRTGARTAASCRTRSRSRR